MADPNEVVNFLGLSLTRREKDNLLSGMAAPAVRRLSPGTKLYRVADQGRASSTTSKVDGEAGSWWFGKKAFGKILQYCLQHDELGRGLGYAAREACAVLFGWSSCDLLIEAYTIGNVRIFYGKGNPQSEAGVTLPGWDDVDQWFIPGISERVSSAGTTHTKLSAKGGAKIKVYRTSSVRSAMVSARSFKR
ncbi:MAG: hypothetical protein AB8G99_11105 [Planctomycetaceae bacterium]